MSNFIKLNRKLLLSDTFSNPITLKIWIWLLLKATWRDRIVSTPNGRGFIDVRINRGQLLFGRKISSCDLNISESSLYRQIQKLKDMGNIEIDANTHYSVITICNYDSYQDQSSDDEPPIRQPIRPPIGQPMIPPMIQHVDTTKESKEVKEDKEEIQLVRIEKKNKKNEKEINDTQSQAGTIWDRQINA